MVRALCMCACVYVWASLKTVVAMSWRKAQTSREIGLFLSYSHMILWLKRQLIFWWHWLWSRSRGCCIFSPQLYSISALPYIHFCIDIFHPGIRVNINVTVWKSWQTQHTSQWFDFALAYGKCDLIWPFLNDFESKCGGRCHAVVHHLAASWPQTESLQWMWTESRFSAARSLLLHF